MKHLELAATVISAFTVPALVNVMNDKVITKPNQTDHQTVLRNRALVNAACAIGLGLVSASTSYPIARAVAFGGAVGTGVFGGVTGAQYIAGMNDAATPNKMGGRPDWFARLAGR